MTGVFQSGMLLMLLLAILASLLQTSDASKTRLTWINGIGYSELHMQEGQEEISKFFGGKPVMYCHNPTGMANEDDMIGYVTDLTQAGAQKLGRITAEVKTLVQHLKDSVAAVGKNGKVIHIAHSQGVLITYLATQQLTAVEMGQIEVLAFGGAAALLKTPRTPFHRCVNYYSVNDPLLLLVPEAARALRTGFVGNNEFCFLAPRIGDPVQDHHLLNPTYAQALKWEGLRFQRSYQTVIYRTTRHLYLLLIAVWQAVTARLHELFKSVVRPYVLWSITCYLRAQSIWEIWTAVLYTKLIKPIILIAALLWEWFRETIRLLRGEDRFTPVSVELLETK